MAWIKSCQELENHPKLMRVMKSLGINRNEAIGLMNRFWWWCIDYAELGDLSEIDPDILGDTLGVPKLLEVLASAGFVDKDPLRVHDWFDYAYEYLKMKYHTSDPKKHEKIVNYRRKIKGLPKVTPKGLPKVTPDKIREDKIREDKNRQDNTNKDSVVSALDQPLTSPCRTGKTKDNGEITVKPNRIPTLVEVQEYIKANSLPIDPEAFFHHYEANGWVQGSAKKPIAKWKSCCHTWVRNKFNNGGTSGKPKPEGIKSEPGKYDNLAGTIK